MTADQFQKTYHNWEADTPGKAMTEATAVNAVAVGFSVRAVGPLAFGRYCLMLDTAVDFLKSISFVKED